MLCFWEYFYVFVSVCFRDKLLAQLEENNSIQQKSYCDVIVALHYYPYHNPNPLYHHFLPLYFQNFTDKQEIPSAGYKIAHRLTELCIADDNSSYSLKFVRLNMVYQTTSGDLELCPIWKAGSTFLKRLFLMHNREEYKNRTTPFDISFRVGYEPNQGFMTNIPEVKRFLFVRDPYKRLLSSYIDKLYAPNPVYWRIIGTRAIRQMRSEAGQKSLRCGHDLTFSEYVKYVILALTPGNTYKATPDIHFKQITTLCKPCQVKYDFVGKIETFRSDSFELMKQLNMSETIESLRDDMTELAADDALRDTLSQPFDEIFREGYKDCITFREALVRAWTKLQMRGLIGRQSLGLPDTVAENITKEQFVDHARKARKMSTEDERKDLRKEYLLSFYATISDVDLNRLREVYAEDFRLFEYSERPNYIYLKR